MRATLELPRLSLAERDRRYAAVRKQMAARSLDAAQEWHRVVEDGDVRRGIDGSFDGVLSIGRLADDLPIPARFQDAPQPLAHNIVVICD